MNAEKVKVGCFQMVLALLLGINYVIVAMSHASPVFHNYTPKFYCQVNNSTSRNYGCQNTVNSSIDANMPVLATCSGKYHFVIEVAESSVVTEWGLVCEKRYLSLLGPTVYYIGALLGAWITGLLADRIGRLPVQAICLYAQGTMAVALYIVQSYSAFLALRGLQGVFVQGLQNSTYILSLELFPARSRTLVALIMQISWSIGLVLLTVLSYVIPDWRILQLAVSVPTAITVLYIWIIPESPRWLLAKGKLTEADMALERIAKYNGCCARLQAENIAEQETCVKSNTMPIKPKRRSRITNIDLKKARSSKNAQEEATDLLNGSERQSADQKITKRSSGTILVNMEGTSSMELQETQCLVEDIVKREASSNLKCDRKLRASLQTTYDQKDFPKAEEQVTLREAIKENDNEDIGKTENNIGEKSVNKINSRLKDFFHSSSLRKYSAIMTCQWLASAIMYNIIDDLSPNFLINRHITFALGGILEIITYTFMYFVVSKYGRRLPMCIYQCFNGIICILVAALFIFTSSTVPWADLVRMIILLFGRVTVTTTISIAYLYTIEMFPTVVRGTYLGLCVVFAKIGSLSMPHLLLSGQYIPIPIPLLTAGMLCLVSGALALILPETLNKVLPDRMADVEKLIDSEYKNDHIDTKNETLKDLMDRQALREKLFSEDWVDAGNGILVNFSENRNTE